MDNQGNNFNGNFNPNFYGGQYNSQYFEEQQRINHYKSVAENEKKEIKRLGNALGIVIIFYFVIQVVAVSLLDVLGLNSLYDSSPVFQSSFNIIAISFLCVAVPFGIMALINKKKYEGPLIPTKKMEGSNIFFWVSFGLGCSIVANYAVAFVIQLFSVFGYELTKTDSLQINSVFACVMAVVGTAIIPAICEEFAMRCCSLQLLKKYGKGFGVVAISIVFGLLHGNVIQFIFAFLVGLVLGLVTVKTNSIVPAMLIHGLNNSMSVVSDIITYALGKDASTKSTIVMYAVFAILGVVGLIGLLVKGQLKKEKEVKQFNPYALTNGQKLKSFFFVPGMIVPLLLLIYLSVKTIVKV